MGIRRRAATEKSQRFARIGVMSDVELSDEERADVQAGIDAGFARIEAAMAETKARQQPSRWPMADDDGKSPGSANRFAALCLKSLANHSECDHFYSFEQVCKAHQHKVSSKESS